MLTHPSSLLLLRPLLALTFAALAACHRVDAGDPGASSDDLTTAAGRSDQACNVVLRRIDRDGDAGFRGVVDVGVDAARLGSAIAVRVRQKDAGAAWKEVVAHEMAAAPPTGSVESGFVPFSFTIGLADLGLVAPVDPALLLEALPLARRDGVELFDHNRRPNDNYVFSAGAGIAADEACHGFSGHDSADTSCQVVLRSVAPPASTNPAGPVEDRFFVWEGFVDVAPSAVAAGARPEVQWNGKVLEHVWISTTRAGAGEGGLDRFEFHLVSDITAESPTALQENMNLIPYLRMPSGDRVYDHNVSGGDYVLDFDVNQWKIASTGAHCR
jgi:hypothetical protein